MTLYSFKTALYAKHKIRKIPYSIDSYGYMVNVNKIKCAIICIMKQIIEAVCLCEMLLYADIGTSVCKLFSRYRFRLYGFDYVNLIISSILFGFVNAAM